MVQVEETGCEHSSLGDVGTLLRVELLNRVAEGPPRGDAYRADVACVGSKVAIAVGVAGGPTFSLETNLAGAPQNVRSRVVALAIAELVRELDGQPRAPAAAPPPLPPPLPAVARPEQDQASPAPPAPVRRSVDFAAFAQASAFQLGGRWLVGGGVRADYVYGRLRVGLEGAVLGVSERFDLGTADALLGYASPTIGWQERWRWVSTLLGLGYALGAASVSGHADAPRAFAGSTSGPWTAPFAFAGFVLALTKSLGLGAQGQWGWVTSPVVGDVTGARSVSLQGSWLSVQAGIALSL